MAKYSSPPEVIRNLHRQKKEIEFLNKKIKILENTKVYKIAKHIRSILRIKKVL